jgi:hypothetical protein
MKKNGNLVLDKSFEDCTNAIRRSILNACLQSLASKRDCKIISNVRRKLLNEESFETQLSGQALQFPPDFAWLTS